MIELGEMKKPDEKEKKSLMCDFCNTKEAVGVFSTHMPMSLAYCQQCLDVNNIRTRHNVMMCWSNFGEKYLENDYTVWFNDKYMSIREYIENLTEADVTEFYKDAWSWLKDKLINKIKELHEKENN